MALIAGAQDIAYGPGVYIPPVIGLGVGLIDGLGTQRVRTYREASLESLVMCVLLAVGVAPALGLPGVVTALFLMPSMALIVGFFSRNATGQRYSRPPAWLLAGTVALSVVIFAGDRIFTEAPSSVWILVATIALTQEPLAKS